MNRALNLVYICLFTKLVLGAIVPFIFDESYYWFWGQNLQLSYYDHPPAISWLYYLGNIFDGVGQASRWPGIILSQLSVVVWLQILKDDLDDKRLFYFAALMSLWPLFGFAAVIITPDVPLIFFWSLSILLLKKCIENPRALTYFAFGLSVGLGGVSKYLMILFIPCLLIYLSWTKQWNKVSWKRSPLVVLGGLLAISPVLIWNYQNDWDSILFQINHGLGESIWKWNWTTDYILGQLLLIFPPVVYFAYKGIKKNKLLASFSVFPLLFFVYSSTQGQVQANWPIMVYPAIAAMAIQFSGGFRWLKISLAIWFAFGVIVLSNAFYYWLPNKDTKLWEFHEYKPYTKIAADYQPMFATNFQMASYLTYLTGKNICKLRYYRRKDFFDYLDCSLPTEERYYLMVYRNRISMPEWAKAHKVLQIIAIDQNHQIYEMEQNP